MSGSAGADPRPGDPTAPGASAVGGATEAGRASPPTGGSSSADVDDAAEGVVGDDGARTVVAEAGAADPAAEPALPDPLTAVTAERDGYLDALRRLQADFDNYRKRTRSDIEMEVGRATEKVVADLLPVLDAFEAALTHEADPDASPLAKLHDTLLGALERHGLERVFPADAPFDPNEAEAVIHEPGDGGDAVVTDVLRAGYRWRQRVMRAAMVKVRG